MNQILISSILTAALAAAPLAAQSAIPAAQNPAQTNVPPAQTAVPPGQSSLAPAQPLPTTQTFPTTQTTTSTTRTSVPTTQNVVPAAQTSASGSVMVTPASSAGRTPARTGAAATFTLQEALQRALQVNNTIERSRAEVQVASANQRYLFSQVLPRITASGAATRNSTEATIGDPPNQATVLAMNDWNYRVVLTQPIYAGNRERRAYEQAQLGVSVAQQGVRGTEDQVLLRVASNYLAIVNSDARLDIERRNIELAQRRRKEAQAFYEAGERTRVDVLQAETSIKVAQRALALAQQNRETAASALRVDLDVDGPIVVTPPAAPARAPNELTLEARAAADRPDVRQAQLNLQNAELEIRKQRGFWFPVVTFEGGYTAAKSGFIRNYGYGRFNFTIPLLQSGEVEARIAGAKARELQAQSTLDESRLSAREDVRKAFSDLDAANTSLQLATEQLAAAEAEYNQQFELYRAQEATSLDLASSEASLADARRAVSEETLNRDLAQLRVWYAAGALKEALGAAGANEAAGPAGVTTNDTERKQQ